MHLEVALVAPDLSDPVLSAPPPALRPLSPQEVSRLLDLLPAPSDLPIQAPLSEPRAEDLGEPAPETRGGSMPDLPPGPPGGASGPAGFPSGTGPRGAAGLRDLLPGHVPTGDGGARPQDRPGAPQPRSPGDVAPRQRPDPRLRARGTAPHGDPLHRPRAPRRQEPGRLGVAGTPGLAVPDAASPGARGPSSAGRRAGGDRAPLRGLRPASRPQGPPLCAPALASTPRRAHGPRRCILRRTSASRRPRG